MNIINIIYFQKVMMEERKRSLKSMAEQEAMKPVFENLQEEAHAAQEELKGVTQQLRHLPEGKYHEAITSDFELTLEYHENKVLISMYSVEGENFRRLVCDDCFSLTAKQIFFTVQNRPQHCCVDGSSLLVGESVRIDLKQIQLDEATKLKIKLSRFIRKYLQKVSNMKPLEEIYCEKLELEKLELEKKEDEQKAGLESLIMDTPHVHRFLIKSNKITLQKYGGKFYQVLLDVVLGKAKPFTLRAHIINNAYVGLIAVGVVDRLTQKQAESSFQSGNAVSYYSNAQGIFFDIKNGNPQMTHIGVGLRKETELRMEVDLENTVVTFIIGGEKFIQKSDILSQSNREFVPYFEMYFRGDSIRWSIQ